MVVAAHVHTVVDEVHRSAAQSALSLELAHDGLADSDEPVDGRRESGEQFAVLLGTHPRGMHGLDEVRPGQAAADQQVRGVNAHDLGAIHVAVHHLRPPALEQVRYRDSGLVVGVDLHDLDAEPQRPPAPDRAAIREADHADVIAGLVDPREQGRDVFLGTAVGAGGDQLHDADPFTVRERQVVGQVEAGVADRGRVHAGAFMGPPPYACSCGNATDHDAVDGLVHGTPFVLVGLVAAQEVEAHPARLDPVPDVGRGPGHSRRELACVRVRPRVVEEARLAVIEADPREDEPVADVHLAQLELRLIALRGLELRECDGGSACCDRRLPWQGTGRHRPTASGGAR